MIERRGFLAAVTTAFLTTRSRADAQPATKIPRVGWLTLVGRDTPLFKAFVDGLQDGGYVIGRNVVVDTRRPEHPDRPQEFADLAAQLVATGADVIFGGGPLAVDALDKATKTTPIV